MSTHPPETMKTEWERLLLQSRKLYESIDYTKNPIDELNRINTELVIITAKQKKLFGDNVSTMGNNDTCVQIFRSATYAHMLCKEQQAIQAHVEDAYACILYIDFVLSIIETIIVDRYLPSIDLKRQVNEQFRLTDALMVKHGCSGSISINAKMREMFT